MAYQSISTVNETDIILVFNWGKDEIFALDESDF